MNPPESLLKELHSLDPNLFIRFSEWELNTETGEPWVNRFGTRNYRPRYSVWLIDRDGKKCFLFYVEDKEKPDQFCPADRRIIECLHQDLANAGYSPSEQARLRENSLREHHEKEQRRLDQLRQDIYRENKRLFDDAVENLDRVGTPSRQAKIFSGEGITHRGTSFEEIPLTDKEIGLVLPEE